MVTLTNAVTRTEESELSRDDLYYLPVGSDFHYWHMHGDPLWSLRSGIETRLKWTKMGCFWFLGRGSLGLGLLSTGCEAAPRENFASCIVGWAAAVRAGLASLWQ